MMNTPFLIVNADDFGISDGVNRGIIEAHQRGILTGATLMANMPAFEHAVGLAGENPGLGVGVHLNLTTGSPVLPASEVPTLVGSDGHLLRLGPLLRALSLGRIDRRQVDAELNAQVERVISAGVPPDHLDSHHHVHTHPALHAVVVGVAVRHGVGGVRCPVELSLGEILGRAGMLWAGAGPHPDPLETPQQIYLKTVLLSLLGRMLRARVRRAGLRATDHFRGLLGVAFTAADLHAMLLRLPGGSTELMCHPGYPDAELASRTSYSTGRDSELLALLGPETRAILDRAGARLGSYRDLGRGA